jgi:16S rRNA (uracil1498-N3)-methyltransferase
LTATRFLVERKNIRFPFARLEGGEHRHLSKVLRARPGRLVWLVDDAANSYEAEVLETGESQTLLKILAWTSAEETAVRITLGQALLKSKKMDWIVQKATELGADMIIPLDTARAIVKVAGGEGRRVERWRKISREAAKQSRRASLPEVGEPLSFRAFLDGCPGTRKLILTEGAGTPLREILKLGPGEAPGAAMPVILLAVGPEGGWTKEEEAESLAAGFEPVSLGRQPLRSETAALGALAMISHFWKS